jgi:hypothetical protein
MRARREARREAGFRYGGVLGLTLLLILALIALPAANWSRALALAIEFAGLTLVIVTSREAEDVKLRQNLLIGGGAAVVIIAVLLGGLPKAWVFAIAAVLSFVIPVSLVTGLTRLARREGVNRRVVAGALAIYLLVGVMFAMTVAFAAEIASTPFFSNGTDGTLSDHVYYSFTVLTTTGFGDYTAAHGGGRALAVLEMLIGQLYLVTVIGVLVGDIAGRRSQSQSAGSGSPLMDE